MLRHSATQLQTSRPGSGPQTESTHASMLACWLLHGRPQRCQLRHGLRCRRGQVLLVTVNEQTMVPFVSTQLQNLDLAMALARRGNLPGAEALVGQNFERLFASGQFKEAAEAAAESPQVSSALSVGDTKLFGACTEALVGQTFECLFTSGQCMEAAEAAAVSCF